MAKQYAYCPRGFIEMIEKRTAEPEYKDDPYPINKFYHGSLLPFFKEIPESQENEVRLLWFWDETDNLFKEPKIGQEVNGEIYIGTIPKERIYEILQENIRLSNENVQLQKRSEQLAAQSKANTEINAFLEDCLVEMAGVVYG